MANKKFIVDIDLLKNQILNAAFQNLVSAPSAPVNGQFYWDTTDTTAYIWDGTQWVDFLGSVSSLSGLTDTTITAVTAGEIITWDGSKWLNQTLAEAGISPDSHNHSLDTLSNVTITANSTGELLVWNGSAWINQNLAELNIAAADAFASHTGDTNTHFIINDSSTAVDEVWSSSKISDELDIVADLISGALIYKGGYNASTNTPNLDSSPSGIIQGYTYTVTANGTFFTEEVEIGDMIIAEITNPTVLDDWTVVNKNIPDIVSASETEEGLIELATSGGTNTGTDDLRAVTPLKLKINIATYRYQETFGNGALTTFTITHNLGTLDVFIQVKEVSTGATIIVDDKAATTNTVTITVNTAPTTNQYRVTIIK